MSVFPNLQPYKQVGSLKCPDCSVYMLPYTCGPVIINKCYACNGIWFDKKEIGIFRDTLGQYDLSELEIYSPENMLARYQVSVCPVCQDVLCEEKYSYNSKVNIQKCTRCRGVWVPFSEVIGLIKMSKVGQNIAPDLRGLTAELKKMNEERWRHRSLYVLGHQLTGPFNLKNFFEMLLRVFRCFSLLTAWLAIAFLRVIKHIIR